MNEIRPQQFGSPAMGNKLSGIAPPPRMTMSGDPHSGDGSSDPIGLATDGEIGGGEAKIKTTSSNSNSVRKDNYKRNLVTSGHGSCRIRSFHGRLSQQGLEYMDNQINDWLDNNTEVEVKFVTSTVGVFEGKMREPAIIMNVWY